jgi:IPT/TIG domain-containing protein
MPNPIVSSVSPTSGPAAGGTSVTVNGSFFTGATNVRFGSVFAPSFTVNSSTKITAISPPGSGTVQVRVTNNDGTSSQNVTFTYTTTPPTLTSVVPDEGPAYGGNNVTLTGTNLSGATAVRFGTTDASSFTVVSSTQITAVVPSGSAGTVDVTVTTPGGTSPPVPYFYTAAPVLTALTPAKGPVAGGNNVTITGQNLLNPVSVSFGAAAATNITEVSSTELTAEAPAGSGGKQVTVTTPGGASNPLPYTYLQAPTLSGVAPAQGPSSGGNIVTLTGTGLAYTTEVTIGGSAVAFSVFSDTEVTATVPSGAAGTVNVTVTTPGGTSAPVTYTRVAPPEI